MSPSGKPRILFVEDTFDQALLVKTFLQSGGEYHLVHSQDGQHALSLLRDQDWDLLITDLNLPGADGFDVIRKAKELHPNLPVLATTGYTSPGYQEQAFRAGASDLVRKPMDREDFLARVRRLLEGANRPERRSAILAVGGLVGDVEMGCGGSLLAAREEGYEVLIVPLVIDSEEQGAGMLGARRAAELLGAELLLEEASMEDTRSRASLVELAIHDIKPELVYVPAMDENHPARREAFRIAKAVTVDIARVLGYQTATTGLDFKPEVFKEVSEQMVMKMEALGAYQAVGAGRPDLRPRMAQAYARYWGRFHNFIDVEAFEVVAGSAE